MDRVDKDRVEAIFREHRDIVFRFAYRLSNDLSLSEDLAADAFSTLLDGKFRGEASVQTYLYRVVLNKWKMHLRSQRLRRIFAETAPGSSDPTLTLELDRAIDGLPANLKSAFILVKVEGFTNAEAGEILNCPTGTVQTRVFRACERLRITLSDLSSPQQLESCNEPIR